VPNTRLAPSTASTARTKCARRARSAQHHCNKVVEDADSLQEGAPLEALPLAAVAHFRTLCAATERCVPPRFVLPLLLARHCAAPALLAGGRPTVADEVVTTAADADAQTAAAEAALYAHALFAPAAGQDSAEALAFAPLRMSLLVKERSCAHAALNAASHMHHLRAAAAARCCASATKRCMSASRMASTAGRTASPTGSRTSGSS
jgi:hypothetical protein